MRKKILFLSLFLVPYVTFAAGLVPCGDKKNAEGVVINPCQFSDIAVLLQNVMSFLLKDLLIPLAVIALVAVGVQYLMAMGNPGKLAKTHEVLGDVLLGIFVALAAWAIINTIFVVMGKGGAMPSITG